MNANNGGSTSPQAKLMMMSAGKNLSPYMMARGPGGQDTDDMETSPYRSKFTVLRLTQSSNKLAGQGGSSAQK